MALVGGHHACCKVVDESGEFHPHSMPLPCPAAGGIQLPEIFDLAVRRGAW